MSSMSTQTMVALLAGAFSLATAITSSMLLKDYKMLPPSKDAKTIYILQIINAVFAAIGLLVAIGMAMKM